MNDYGTDYRRRIYERYTSEKMSFVASMSDADRTRWSRSVAKRLRNWLPRNPDASILDVGCGAGNLLYALRLRGYRRLLGIDVSPEQVSTAVELGFDVRQANAIEFLASQRNCFDAILAFDVIEHMRKDEIFEFLDGCRKALAIGGSLILQTPNAESPWGMMYRYHDFTHEVAFDPCALEHVLSVANFGNFAARESGPDIHGVISLCRWIAWRVIALGLKAWNLAETGSAGSGIYTRNFVARAVKLAA